MDPMYLPDVENACPEGAHGERIRAVQSRRLPVPQIWHLFAFKPEATTHLSRYTQQVMRGPSALSPGLRELIAAFVSRHNECRY